MSKKNIKPTEIHIVPISCTPIRLQEYGVGVFNSALTKSALKKALKKKYIRVNGLIATTATIISGGETIELFVPQKIETQKKIILPLKILFEDEFLAVIHKPAGILVSGNKFKTIANALSQNLKQSKLLDATTPQPVHRLDYPTTGVLLIGKTSSSIRALNKMFESKAIEKIYYAITIGHIENTGVISTKIDSKESRSEYTLIESVSSKRFGKLNLVKLKPKTGRRHQLRIHLASIGNPILGDKEYGTAPLILNGKGLYLHAYSLNFKHPFTNKIISLKEDLPKRFTKIFHQPQVSANQF